MKKLLTIAALSLSALSVSAQNQANMDAAASQTVNLLLSNAIDITFTSNGSATGPVVNLQFNTVNDYANGVESAQQELKVRSTKKFKIEVKTNTTNFTYSGTTTPAPTMPVSGVLGMKVTSNSTGGTLSGPYTTTSFYSLREFNQLVLLDCNPGSNQAFSFMYKATPGFVYPAGAYAIDVVYTATQI
ncbi:MAG: hypothetical protein H6550_12870 [Chitinophagales bacterium]|nr:hypothetical protein [Chitinophagales bacterium]